MTNYGPCCFCGGPVTEAHTPCYPVHGWEALREGGGANKIMWRQRDDTTVAHETCVNERASRERKGINEEQGTLV